MGAQPRKDKLTKTALAAPLAGFKNQAAVQGVG